MSDSLDRLIRKAQGDDLFVDPTRYVKPKATEANAVRHDRFDRFSWLTTLDQVGALREQVDAAGEKHEFGVQGQEDLFNLLSKEDPRFTEFDLMLDGAKAQHRLLESLSSTDEFGYIRSHTKLDEYNTALAMISMKEKMDQLQETADEINEALAAAQQAVDEAIAAAQAAQGQGEQAEGQAEESLQEAMDALAEAQAQADKQEAKAEAQLQKGLQDATKEIEKQDALMSGYGVEDGDLRRMSFEERRALAERLDQNTVGNFADLLGSFKMMANAESKRKVTGAPAEIVDIEAGNDLNKVMPSEFANLAVPELEDVFFLRFFRHQLMQRKTKGVERTGKGPIIVVGDESGSMGCVVDNEGHSREAWMKAVALALCDQARRGGRDFHYIGFSSTGQQWHLEFPGGKTDIDKVIMLGEHMFNGGTSYERPIAMAANIVRDYQKRGKEMPDVVFITDDDCRVSEQFVEEWRELREAAKIRCYGLQIGGEPFRNQLKDLADRCMNIDSMNAHPTGVVELFRTI